MEEPWAGLSERTLVAMVEQLFSHLLKVLNICAHVLDDTPPGPAVKVTVQSFFLLGLVWLIVEAIILKLPFTGIYMLMNTSHIHSRSIVLTSLSVLCSLHFRRPSLP